MKKASKGQYKFAMTAFYVLFGLAAFMGIIAILGGAVAGGLFFVALAVLSFLGARKCSATLTQYEAPKAPADSYENRRQQYIENQQAAFSAQLSAIPVVSIAIDSATVLNRLRLSDMPEAKYSSVTASFNPDRLPSFVVIDTETNGIKIQGGRILELSAIRYEDFQPVAAWTSLVNPAAPIPADATAVNGITDDMVATAPTLSQVAASFLEFVGNSPLVGYNLPFDLKFLYSRGIDLVGKKRKCYDVLEIARRAYKKDEVFSYKLIDVAEACDIFPDTAHRSLADCYTTARVFQNCIDVITGR